MKINKDRKLTFLCLFALFVCVHAACIRMHVSVVCWAGLGWHSALAGDVMEMPVCVSRLMRTQGNYARVQY